VPRATIQRLYAGEAAGLIDDELLDDVGTRLYLRCQTILAVRRIQLDRLAYCPDCDEFFPRIAGQPDSIIECPVCGRRATWAQYWSTFRHKEIAGPPDLLDEFMTSWRRARSSSDKMLAIDRAIHRWHHENTAGKPLGRPFGVNLIEGSRKQVIEFLDTLTYGSAANKARWRAGLARVTAANRVGDSRRPSAD
jgi:hypothetical protein